MISGFCASTTCLTSLLFSFLLNPLTFHDMIFIFKNPHTRPNPRACYSFCLFSNSSQSHSSWSHIRSSMFPSFSSTLIPYLLAKDQVLLNSATFSTFPSFTLESVTDPTVSRTFAHSTSTFNVLDLDLPFFLLGLLDPYGLDILVSPLKSPFLSLFFFFLNLIPYSSVHHPSSGCDKD